MVWAFFTGWVLWITVAFGQEAPPEVPDDTAVVVAVSPFSPFVQLDQGAEPKGFSVDLFEAVAREEGLTVEYRAFANVTE
ncbi:MAG: hypothetical protein AAF211_31550, partial [Myxococcota bacterium]